jgi:hypothetical protein
MCFCRRCFFLTAKVFFVELFPLWASAGAFALTLDDHLTDFLIKDKVATTLGSSLVV